MVILNKISMNWYGKLKNVHGAAMRVSALHPEFSKHFFIT
jgi:hypothetical protein